MDSEVRLTEAVRVCQTLVKRHCFLVQGAPGIAKRFRGIFLEMVQSRKKVIGDTAPDCGKGSTGVLLEYFGEQHLQLLRQRRKTVRSAQLVDCEVAKVKPGNHPRAQHALTTDQA